MKKEYAEGERMAGMLLRKVRRHRGWSQRDVAEEMSALGFDWRQPTVSRIETGRRHLLLVEAQALMDLFELNEAVKYKRIEPLPKK